jgi:hypothetical protein
MSEIRNPFYEEGVIAERERILRLLGDKMVPEILSRINPAVNDYNKLMQLIIDLVKDEEVQA